MNKQEFVREVAIRAGMSSEDAAKAVDAFTGALEAELAAGGSVKLVGFGTFSVKERGPRMGRNLRTGEPIEIPPSKIVSFKAGRALSQRVNE